MPTDAASVFIADWRDHPGKDQAWYDARKAKAEREGLLHVFHQEVDRSYDASVEGVIIPAEWVRSAIDAHRVLGIPEDGPWVGALDVADGGGDVNADAWFKGIVLKEIDTWTARDTGVTARRFLGHAEGRGHVELQYDAIGVGTGIKAEANRLADEGELSPLVRLVPWVASASPLEPNDPVIPDDRDSPINKDFFENLKAQAWWRARTRFEKTHRAVEAARAAPSSPGSRKS
jgi:phage terminase large subunit